MLIQGSSKHRLLWLETFSPLAVSCKQTQDEQFDLIFSKYNGQSELLPVLMLLSWAEERWHYLPCPLPDRPPVWHREEPPAPRLPDFVPAPCPCSRPRTS